MRKRRKPSRLEGLKEDILRRDVIVPLLAATPDLEGVADVHGRNEKGLDVIFFSVSAIERLCYGIQIKIGDISGGGRGTGTVRDLVNQLELARELDHPVVIEGGRRVRIDRFIVASNGRISETAREEIAARARPVEVQFWDRTELERRIHRYLPELLSLTDGTVVAYLKALQNRFNTLDALDSVPGVAKRTLTEVFEEPALRRQFDPSLREDEKASAPATIPALSLSLTHTNSVVLAEQDGGKTSLLRMMALQQARSILGGVVEKDDYRVPVIVSARELAANAGDVHATIKDQCTRLGAETLLDHVREDGGLRLLLLVDGFSEVLDPDDKVLIEAALLDFADEHRHVQLVVAARPMDFLTPRYFSAFRHYFIVEFDQKQVASLLRRWTLGAPGMADVARRMVTRVREALQLPGSPISATIGVMLYEKERRYITNIAEAVDRYMVIRLGRYSDELGISQEIEWTRKQDLLADVAFDMLEAGKDVLAQSEIVARFDAAFDALGEPPQGTVVLRELLDSGVLFREGESIAFHRTAFRDFFAAHAIVQRPDPEAFFSEKLLERKWGMALVFAAGLRRRNSRLLMTLTKEIAGLKTRELGDLGDDYFYASYLLGRLLSNSESSTKDARLTVIRRCLEACIDSLPEFEAIAVAQVGNIGKVAALLGIEQTFFITVGVPWLAGQFRHLLASETLSDESRYLLASTYANLAATSYVEVLDESMQLVESTRVLLVLETLLAQLENDREDTAEHVALKRLIARIHRRLSKPGRKDERKQLLEIKSGIIKLEIQRLRRLEKRGGSV